MSKEDTTKWMNWISLIAISEINYDIFPQADIDLMWVIFQIHD